MHSIRFISATPALVRPLALACAMVASGQAAAQSANVYVDDGASAIAYGASGAAPVPSLGTQNVEITTFDGTSATRVYTTGSSIDLSLTDASLTTTNTLRLDSTRTSATVTDPATGNSTTLVIDADGVATLGTVDAATGNISAVGATPGGTFTGVMDSSYNPLSGISSVGSLGNVLWGDTETEGGVQFRVIAVRAGRPEAAVTERVDRVEHVHRRGASREQLLDFGDAFRMRHGRGDRNHERRRESLLPAMRVRFARRVRRTRRGDVDEHVAERAARVATHEHETPRPQLAVIGRTHRGIEDHAELVVGGTGFGERPVRLARQQRGEGGAGVGLLRDIDGGRGAGSR